MSINVLPPLKWTPSPNFSSRNGARVRLIVAHDCEGSYTGSINWFAQARSQVSAHVVLREDGGEATQMVAWANKAWHVCAFNGVSEGIEAAGYSAKGFDAPEWDALAAIIAWRLHQNGLPCRFAEGGIGDGFCQHVDLGAAGGGHHDLTSDPAVRDAFIRRVQAAYALPQPDVWGKSGASVPLAPKAYTPSTNARADNPEGTLAWAQAQLNALGMARPALIVDGIDGPATERAAAAFQSTHGLHVDGVIGPQTLAALKAA